MRYIHGFHVGAYADHAYSPWETTGAALMADRPGVLVFTELVGDGHDYRVWSDAGYTVLVRLNYSYGDGTIPPIAQYGEFAQRCAAMVADSRGVDGWIIGNEVNHKGEWPDGVEITPYDYHACFLLCRRAIQKAVPSAQMLIAGIAPYNADMGGWVDYLEIVLEWLDGQYDGIVLHCYTHGHNPALITSEQMMDAPYQDRHFEFRAYRDFMSVIPDGVPVWITETNPGADPDHRQWDDVDNGWCWEAYREIDQWNHSHPSRQIRGLCLYRYPKIDAWWIAGNAGVEADFAGAVAMGYEWTEEEPMAEWTTTYTSSMDDGFYQHQGIGPLTVPQGSVPLWEHDADPPTDLPRPEYAERLDPHVHVGPYAAGLFSMHSTMEAALVWEITVKPGDEVRASCWANGNDGDQGALGARLGIAVDNPGAGAIEVQAQDGKFAGVLESRANWGDWYGARVDDEWRQLWTPVETATRDRVWIMMNARKDVANPAHSHWDTLIVEVRSGDVVPPVPPTGTWRTVTYDPAGNVAGEVSFEVSSADAQVNALAQQIVDLTK